LVAHDHVDDAGSGRLPDPAQVPCPWRDSYSPEVPTTYPYPPVPLTRLLDDAAIDFPHNEAVRFRGASVTYRQMLDRVDRFASALASLGVGQGERIGVLLPNCPQHVVAVLAAWRLGAIVVEINPGHDEEQLAGQLSDASCRVVVCLDSAYPRLAQIADRTPSITEVIVTGLHNALPFPKNRLVALRGRWDATYHKIVADAPAWRLDDLIKQSPPAPPPVEIDPVEDVAVLLYTGGTGGSRTATMLTHANVVANAFQVRLWLPDIRTGAENVLCGVPLFHAYGMITGLGLGLLSAATLTLQSDVDAATTLATINKHRPTILPGTPALYVALSQAEDVDAHDLSSLRVLLSWGAPLAVEVATAVERLTGARLRQGYGLTEAGAVTHANPVSGKAKAGSVGVPLPDTVCTLRDVDDPRRPAPQGEPGELAIAGPQVMAGYWNRPADTAATLVDGWLLTGDLATVDDEGYFSIVGRKQELIPVGDRFVYPSEVEAVLCQHPAVRQAAVAGVPDECRGQKVKAYVVCHQGAEVTDDGILAFVAQQLAPYKLPRHIEFRAELPRDVAGRTLRRQLSAETDSAAD
jgi:long-chain acyl-CoA synthetase